MFHLVDDQLQFRFRDIDYRMDNRLRFLDHGGSSDGRTDGWEVWLDRATDQGDTLDEVLWVEDWNRRDTWYLDHEVVIAHEVCTTAQLWEMLHSYRECSYYPVSLEQRSVVAEDLEGYPAHLDCCTVDVVGGEVPALSLDECQVQSLPRTDYLAVRYAYTDLRQPLTLTADHLLLWIDDRPPDHRSHPVHLEAPVVYLQGTEDPLDGLTVRAHLLLGDTPLPEIRVSWAVEWAVLAGQVWKREDDGWVPAVPPYRLQYQLSGHDLQYTAPPPYQLELGPTAELAPGWVRIAGDHRARVSARRGACPKSARSLQKIDG